MWLFRTVILLIPESWSSLDREESLALQILKRLLPFVQWGIYLASKCPLSKELHAEVSCHTSIPKHRKIQYLKMSSNPFEPERTAPRWSTSSMFWTMIRWTSWSSVFNVDKLRRPRLSVYVFLARWMYVSVINYVGKDLIITKHMCSDTI